MANDLGGLLGALAKQLIKDGAAILKDELEPLAAALKEKLSDQVDAGAAPVVATQVMPSDADMAAGAEAARGAESSKLVIGVREAAESLPEAWQEPGVSGGLRWLASQVRQCVIAFQFAVNNPVDREFGPMTPNEGAYALGIVFGNYIEQLGGERAKVECALALKRWFDQGLGHYERAQKEFVQKGAPTPPLP